MKTSQCVIYSGRVQGVGFRYTVKQIAAGYDVTGWVRNLPDGRVELRAAGDPPEVAAFLAAIKEGQLAQNIRQAEQTENADPHDAAGFEIRY